MHIGTYAICFGKILPNFILINKLLYCTMYNVTKNIYLQKVSAQNSFSCEYDDLSLNSNK